MIKENKTISIINQDSGYLMIDIANAFVENGFKVNLITGRLVQRNKSLHPNVRIINIVKYNRNSTFKRAATWGLATLQLLFLGWFRLRKTHLLIVSNPPTATLLPLVIKNSYSLLIYDVYPDALVEYNVFKKDSYLIKKWQKVNTKIYKKAATILTLNEGMKNRLAKYIFKDNIAVVPIWTDNSFLQPISKENNPFVIEHKLQDKFIIMYSGNLGKTHNIEILISLAEMLKDESSYILIIGGGTQFTSIQSLIKQKELKNIKLLPWQPVEKLPFTLASADIGVVSLGSEASNLSIPSKTFNLMSVGTPILSISEADSALGKLIEEYRIGQNFKNTDVENIHHFVESLKEDKELRSSYSANSLKASKNFGPNNAFKIVKICMQNI